TINKMINPFATVLFICTLALPVGNAQAQAATLTLPQCQALATENYPMVKQRDLIAKSAAYAVDQYGTRSLPQININGQATYQSTVTEIPIHVPGMDIPTMNKDQYKWYGEINQNLYDGGLTRLGKAAIEAEADMRH